MKKALAIVSLAAAQLLGCTTANQIQSQSPPAKQPHDVQVKAAIGPTPGWVVVTPDASGSFPVLPMNTTNNSIQATFLAPWPTSIQVDVDGTILKRKEDLPNDPNILLNSGYYVQVSTVQDPNGGPDFQWTMTIVPPRGKWGNSSIGIHLTDVSINPNYSGTQARSAPANIALSTLPRNLVNVTRAGPGAGRVFDSTGTLDCGLNCSHDYGANTSMVLLNAEAMGTSIVTGWNGAPCVVGATTSCTIAMDGTPKNITVSFGPEPDFAQGNFVPVASSSPCGYTFAQNGNAINIMNGSTLVASYQRRGRGTWNVYFNQNPNQDVCGSAIIVERGIPNGGPSSREQLTQYTLGLRSSVQVNTMTAGMFGKIMQSPDGRVFSVTQETTISPPSWSVAYVKAQGVTPGRLMGTAFMNACDATMLSNPFPRMQASNTAAVQCYGDPNRPWATTHLQ